MGMLVFPATIVEAGEITFCELLLLPPPLFETLSSSEAEPPVAVGLS